MAKAAKAVKPLSKTQLFATISETTGLSKKDVAAVFDALTDEIQKAVSRRGPGALTIPGLCKIYVHNKKATKKRMGRNPQTGEEIVIAAKPASKVIKVRALKNLKDMLG